MSWTFLGLGPLGWTFGAIVAATVLIGALVARRNPGEKDMAEVGLILAVVWVSARLADAELHIPLSMLLYPAVDAVAAMLIFDLWARQSDPPRQPATWKFVVGSTLFLQVIVHAAFWFKVITDGPPSDAIVWRYVLALNILFLAQHGAANIGGLLDVGGRRGYGLHLIARWGHRHRAAPDAHLGAGQ